MRTAYTVTRVPDWIEVIATTEFALDIAVVGDVFDSTVIERQRRTELAAQFDWLEERCVDRACRDPSELLLPSRGPEPKPFDIPSSGFTRREPLDWPVASRWIR